MSSYIDIVFDGPPGPVSGRFIEVEDADGHSINAGEWIEDAPSWRLRIPKSSHTPGPLRVAKPNPYGGIVETEDGQAIAQTFALDRNSPETIDENAQRFVALWNGCEGINPASVKPTLEALKALLSVVAHIQQVPLRHLAKANDAIALAEDQS